MVRRVFAKLGRVVDLARLFHLPPGHPDRMIAAQIVVYGDLGSSTPPRSGTIGRRRIRDSVFYAAQEARHLAGASYRRRCEIEEELAEIRRLLEGLGFRNKTSS